MNRFKNILCVIENGAASLPALERAVSLAENNQAQLSVIEVISHIPMLPLPEASHIPANLDEKIQINHSQALDKLVEPYRKKIKIKTNIVKGTTFLEVIREVLRNEYDLLIKVVDDQDWLDHLVGSDDMHLLRKCPCPTWLVKPSAPKAYRRILAAIDIDDAYPAAELKAHHSLNQQIIELASSIAISDFAELHIAHVWNAEGESIMRGAFFSIPEDEILSYVEQIRLRNENNLNHFIADMSKKLKLETFDYLKPKTHLIKGLPRQEIPVLTKQIDADLIVMGTVARTGIPGFIMGNTAETILNQIDCSVLAVKPEGFRTPITVKNK